jgi:hypothetical protein
MNCSPILHCCFSVAIASLCVVADVVVFISVVVVDVVRFQKSHNQTPTVFSLAHVCVIGRVHQLAGVSVFQISRLAVER